MIRWCVLLLLWSTAALAVPPGIWTETADAQRVDALEKRAESLQDATIWRQAGDAAFKLDDPARALRAWSQAEQLAGPSVGLTRRVAVGAYQVGDFERAAESHAWVAESIAKHLTAPRVAHLCAAAEAAALAGDLTTGEQHARAAWLTATSRRQRVSARLAQAYVHLMGLEHDEAEGLYQEVLAVAPTNTVALNNLGNIHYLRRDFEAAAAHFVAILEDPKASAEATSIASANLAELSLLTGRYKDARWLYDQARLQHPRGAWSYFGLATLAAIEGDDDIATHRIIDGWQRDATRLTRLNTVFVQPEWRWQHEALVAEVEGDLDRAEARWRWVLAGDVEALHPVAERRLGLASGHKQK